MKNLRQSIPRHCNCHDICGDICRTVAHYLQDSSEATIKELERQRSQAASTGDTEFLECLYDSNFHYVDSKGGMIDNAQDIANAKKISVRRLMR